MKPTWEAEGVKLYHADCLDVLPTLQGVDAVITDPPYGLGDRMSGGTWGAAEKYANLREWDSVPSVGTLMTIAKLGEVCVMWGGNHFGLPPSRGWLVWDKVRSMPTMADVELAWTNLDMPAKRKVLPGVKHSYGHPTEKPVDLMLWCLSISKVPNESTVLDPYMGSGTTGIACIRTGRKFIGIEKDAKHFETARARIQRELAQGVLKFDEKKAEMEQLTIT